MVADGLLQLMREFDCGFWGSLFAEEPDPEFVDTADFVDWENRFNGGKDGAVVRDVEGGGGGDEDNVGAE